MLVVPWKFVAPRLNEVATIARAGSSVFRVTGPKLMNRSVVVPPDIETNEQPDKPRLKPSRAQRDRMTSPFEWATRNL